MVHTSQYRRTASRSAAGAGSAGGESAAWALAVRASAAYT